MSINHTAGQVAAKKRTLSPYPSTLLRTGLILFNLQNGADVKKLKLNQNPLQSLNQPRSLLKNLLFPQILFNRKLKLLSTKLQLRRRKRNSSQTSVIVYGNHG